MASACLKFFECGLCACNQLKEATEMNKEEIKKILPHREPMLLIDEAERLPDGSAHGQLTVRGDEWFLQGHFPGNPVVPGVMLCEMMGQTCCVMLSDTIVGKTPYFTGMEKVKFHHPVKPGDVLDLHCEVVREFKNFYFTQCQCTVGGKLAASGELSFALVG